MLYHLFQYLKEDYSWLNVFRYVTFRAMIAFLLTFIIVIVAQPIFIRWLKERGVKGQPIREDGPKDHHTKSGTPTMGGIVVVAAVLFSTLLLTDLSNASVWLTIGVMSGFGVIGFVDDWRKITKQNSAGLSERQKLGWQFGIGIAVALYLWFTGFTPSLAIPYTKGVEIALGILFIPFVAIVIAGASNAVNLTDGLDGLAIGPVMTVSITYAIIAYLSGNAIYAEYLGIFRNPGVGELVIILAAMTAAGLGFLWYNTFPAQIFMGDLGALSLGATIGLVSVLVKHELILVLCGGVFVIEALSVLIQRYYYKMTGKRVFRMAPIHHHFELLGWAEPKIIVRFWIISIVLAIISLTSLKIR